MAISVREARAIIRRAVKRVPEGEAISHLNIMPMMDMMTILLVAFIFQVATGAEAITANNVDLPASVSQEPMPEASTVIIISERAIVVEGKEVAAVRNGDVDKSNKEGGVGGRKILPLVKFLKALRTNFDAELRAKGKKPPSIPEIMIVADELTPYHLLVSVIYSAGLPEVGYLRFRLVTLLAHDQKT
jgi:biopolymer transport protein ExbD